jgi:hypothetical protein
LARRGDIADFDGGGFIGRRGVKRIHYLYNGRLIITN